MCFYVSLYYDTSSADGSLAVVCKFFFSARTFMESLMNVIVTMCFTRHRVNIVESVNFISFPWTRMHMGSKLNLLSPERWYKEKTYGNVKSFTNEWIIVDGLTEHACHVQPIILLTFLAYCSKFNAMQHNGKESIIFYVHHRFCVHWPSSHVIYFLYIQRKFIYCRSWIDGYGQ